jgi:ferredoxin
VLLPSSDVAMSSRLSQATPPTSPRPAAGDPFAPLARAHRFGAWRAGALFSVYVLMVVHILHWQLAGRTLAPLELHEVMYTAELGVVTAGFLFMAGTLLLTAVFGRFFCGWACHLLALQDLSAWLLKKLGIRRKPIRARVIAWAPFVIMFYMFVWPQLERIADGRPHPGFRFAGDEEPIASFTTTNFWRNLPDPWIALLTFVVCGGWIVYVLGSRGFCTHACPYGAAFRLLDRLAPGRIRVDDKCTQCGTCTKVCTSGIQVHDQLRTHGTVIDPRCLKDLDCVGSCPHDALHYGFGAPALFTQRRAGELPRQRAPEFALAVDLFLGIGFLVVLLVYRGLYGTVPFLMSVGLGAGVPYAALVSWRPRAVVAGRARPVRTQARRSPDAGRGAVRRQQHAAAGIDRPQRRRALLHVARRGCVCRGVEPAGRSAWRRGGGGGGLAAAGERPRAGGDQRSEGQPGVGARAAWRAAGGEGAVRRGGRARARARRPSLLPGRLPGAHRRGRSRRHQPACGRAAGAALGRGARTARPIARAAG